MSTQKVNEFRLSGGNETSFMSRVNQLAQDFDRLLSSEELRAGDVIKSEGKLYVVTDIDDGIYAKGENGQVKSFNPGTVKVSKRMPYELTEWVFSALEGELVEGYLLLNSCWKCKSDGWAFILTTTGPYITEGAELFHYPGVIRQLREFFQTHQAIRSAFGKVKKRFSKKMGAEYLSQGCPKCDSLWGDFPLGELYLSYVPEWDEAQKDGRIFHAFTLDVLRLFDEGETKELKEIKERAGASHKLPQRAAD